MMVNVEERRIGWTRANPRLAYDNSVGLMHHVYGDGVSAPGILPRPGLEAPNYLPFPGGNPLLPTLRENFRPAFGLDADPIHLDFDGYQYKITQQVESYFLPRFRFDSSSATGPEATLRSEGGERDGWTDGGTVDTSTLRLGDDGAAPSVSILSFDTSSLPDGIEITAASLYLQRSGVEGSNPFLSGDLGNAVLDVASGSFGEPELEAGDATAPADATNAGCFVGSVRDDHYALRVDFTPEGLAAINSEGLTQLRLSFPTADPGADAVFFHTGDGQLLRGAERLVTRIETVWEPEPNGGMRGRSQIVRAIAHQGLGEALGSPAPLLDLHYDATAFRIFEDGFESGDTSAWAMGE